MNRVAKWFLVFAFAAVLPGCSGTVRTADNVDFTWSSPVRRVVLIAPDVEVGSFQAGGGTEYRADWTLAAKTFIRRDIANYLVGKGAELVSVDELTDPREVQLSRLHGVVGRAILTHLYGANQRLPNKGKALDWSLGPGVTTIRDHYGADYALFVYIRDSYTSSGRAAYIVGAAILGATVSGGERVGFASLVDLRTGQIVWFNVISDDTGDFRSEARAQRTVSELIKGFPL